MAEIVDISLFAPVARATNTIYMYVTEDHTIAQITTSGYFNHYEITGSVKVGDVIIVNSLKSSGGGFGFLTVTAVDPDAGTMTVATPQLVNKGAATSGGG